MKKILACSFLLIMVPAMPVRLSSLSKYAHSSENIHDDGHTGYERPRPARKKRKPYKKNQYKPHPVKDKFSRDGSQLVIEPK